MPANLNGQDYKLKYLFKALFWDGSTFEQPQDDHSEIDAQKSAFTDVLESGKRVRSFGLFGNGHALVVDLIDGHFEHNGLSIHPEILPPGPAPLKLIFFRQVQRDMQINYKNGEQNINQVQNGVRVKYFLGWECSLNGKKYKQVLGLS